ncbi:MAG: replication-associated recombination protein A [Candidatus Omnitrophota bacterium]
MLKGVPLAVRMRPQNLEEFIGQEHILSPGKVLRRAISSRRLPSLIAWGPPGSGKTSLGLVISRELDSDFEYLNAAFSSVPEVKKSLAKAKKNLASTGRKTTIFIDEFHRFNKLQQETLVPDTEAGSITLVGATIHNPSYYLIPSLISRSIVVQFKALLKDDIVGLLKRACKDKEKGLGGIDFEMKEDALNYIAQVCGGDARSALNALEIGVLSSEPAAREGLVFDLALAKNSVQKKVLYDRRDGYHYDTISAFIKSIRGSDVDSALYWLAKMLKSGEDPRFIARRLIILASEDIGNANPFALVLATNCFKAVEVIGMPESDLILAQTVIYLAASLKSNSAYLAIKKALKSVEEEPIIEVPDHIKTHSKDYKYPHDFGGFLKQNYGVSQKYYYPKDVGSEKKLKEFLESLNKVTQSK